MKTKITSRTINLSIIILVTLFLSACATFAQTGHRPTHIGGEISFGINGFVPEAGDFRKLRAMAHGGSIGFVIGNPLLKTRIRTAGVYFPSQKSRSDGQIVDAEALVNLYPLEFLRTHKNILDIYFTTGFRYAHVSITFGKNQDSPDFSKQKGNVLSQISGVGGEYRLPGVNKFSYLFAEIIFANPIGSNANTPLFINVWTHKSASANFGVRFGIQRSNANVNRGKI